MTMHQPVRKWFLIKQQNNMLLLTRRVSRGIISAWKTSVYCVTTLDRQETLLQQTTSLDVAQHYLDTHWAHLDRKWLEGRVRGAWKALNMPKWDGGPWFSGDDGNGWYLTGYMRYDDDEQTSYAVVPASGPGSHNGIAFEKL